MAAKKKTTKKTPAKTKTTKKAKKTAKVATKAAVTKLTEVSNTTTLADAGVIEDSELTEPEKAAINSQLTPAEVETLITVFGKLNGAMRGGRVRVQLCF